MPETEEGKRAPRKIETQIQIIFPSCTVFFGVLRVFFYIHKASKQFAPLLYIVFIQKFWKNSELYFF